MRSNFYFLKNDWNILARIGEMAEYNLNNDPNTAIIKIRQLGEYIAKAIIKAERIEEVNNDNQLDRIKLLKEKDLISDEIEAIFHIIRKKGNKAVHKGFEDKDEAETLLSLVVKLSAWFNELYGSDINFDSQKISFQKPQFIDYKEAYEKLLRLVEKDEKEKRFDNLDILSISSKSNEERARFRKSKRGKVELSEAETRMMIDQQLIEAGWEADTINLNYKTKGTLPDSKRFLAIAEWPCIKEEGKKGYVDYALFYGKTLYGVIEAKRYSKDVASALKRDSRMYSKGIVIPEGVKLCEGAPFLNEYEVPFMFSSNGREYNEYLIDKSGIWFLDGRRESNSLKAIKGFYSPRDLKELLEKDEMLANHKLEESSLEYLSSATGLNLRDYQLEAVKAVEKALIKGQNKILLTMATGTGKTRTALAILYRLLKAKKYNRILFVVDRSTLGIQAKETFDNAKIENELPISKIYDIKGLKDKSPEDTTKVHIATVQGLVKRILYSDEKPTVGQYDCIIIDEAHRGYILDRIQSEEEENFRSELDYRSKYKCVIDYFQADKIALTATPALHTYEIFGEPVYQYSYRQAVLDGYLVDFEPPYIIKTKLSTDGIHYEKGAEVKVYDNETKKVSIIKNLEDQLDFDVDKFNTSVITENFNRVVCSCLTQYINPYGPEKTLIFAATDEHADMIVRILKEEFDKVYFDMNNDMIEKITGSVKDVDKLIKKFKNETYPTIAVTVDLLTTGIDVPSISNLVFLRKVKSRILYEQMLGRATRRCDEIGKEYFRIYDAVDIYSDLEEYSDMKPVVTNPKLNIESLFKDLEKLGKEEEGISYFRDEIIARIQRKKKKLEKKGSEYIEDMFSSYGKDSITTIDDYIKRLEEISTEKLYDELIKEKEFLIDLDRVKIGVTKQVISTDEDKLQSISQEFGNKRPEDYLESFKNFIIENEDKIIALKLLKTTPEKFTRKELREIVTRLDSEGFTQPKLESAYKTVKNEDILTNMISFIKYAIKGAPIVDRDESINDVISKIKKLNRWSVPQKQLIDNIGEYLKRNEILTREDFETGFFKEYGGYKRFDTQLNGMLNEIIEIVKKDIILN